jgi:hypothetical protein
MDSNAARSLCHVWLPRKGWAVVIRVGAILFLGLAACAHDHELSRREAGAMENASPAISPWSGPEADPIAVGQVHAGVEAAVNGGGYHR